MAKVATAACLILHGCLLTLVQFTVGAALLAALIVFTHREITTDEPLPTRLNRPADFGSDICGKRDTHKLRDQRE